MKNLKHEKLAYLPKFTKRVTQELTLQPESDPEVLPCNGCSSHLHTGHLQPTKIYPGQWYFSPKWSVPIPCHQSTFTLHPHWWFQNTDLIVWSMIKSTQLFSVILKVKRMFLNMVTLSLSSSSFLFPTSPSKEVYLCSSHTDFCSWHLSHHSSSVGFPTCSSSWIQGSFLSSLSI